MVKAALIGAPNSGKSTLFCALTGVAGRDSPAPFFSYELASAQLLPNPLMQAEVIDLPGIARDSHAGEWLGLDWIETARHADALVMVVKSFQTGAGPLEQPGCTGNPLYDLEMVERELLIADLVAIDRQLAEVGPEHPSGEMLRTVRGALAGGQFGRQMGLPPDELTGLLGLPLLTALPCVYVLNIDELPALDDGYEAADHMLVERLAFRDAETVWLCARLHADAALLGQEEGRSFLADLGVDTDAPTEVAYALARVLAR